MTFVDFLVRGIWSKKARSLGLILAVAFAVMIIVSLNVTSSNLKQSAADVISIG
jgi:hypothetical protein